MSSVTEEQLSKTTTKDQRRLRRECSDNHDIESLLTIAKYRFKNGSAALNETILPEMCYYFGRLHRTEELQNFLKDKNFYLMMLPKSCKELAQNLLNIGIRFPDLNEDEITYLENNYCDSKTFELFDIIMFDCNLLARQINKFDKQLLTRENKDFSREFSLQIFDSFLENETKDPNYDELFTYSRIENKITRKLYKNLGLGEFCIIQPIHSNELWNLLHSLYGNQCADFFLQKLSRGENWEEYKISDFFLLEAKGIERIATQYFNDISKVDDIKSQIALAWLQKINSHRISLT